MSVYVGIVIGYGSTTGSAKGFSEDSDLVYKIPISINFIYAGIFFLATFFLKDSPRALAKKGKQDEAIKTLAWYRGMSVDSPYVQEEFGDILEENQREAEAMHGQNMFSLLKIIFTSRINLFRVRLI